MTVPFVLKHRYIRRFTRISRELAEDLGWTCRACKALIRDNETLELFCEEHRP